MRDTSNTNNLRRSVVGLTLLVAGLAVGTGAAIADDTPVSMAPPLGSAVSIGTYSANGARNSSDDTVFNYTEIPSGDQIPLKRAVFDQGGYQLFDTMGQTIVVSFTNQNLYVMKFAVSPDNTMYFVNDDGAPTLYVPQNGYLENATVPGAKWYPFSNNFRPTTPVYMGAAPSYTQYVNTGWYPNSVLYGGYYCPTSYIAGGVFQPTYGFSFAVGGLRYTGWNAYCNYLSVYPAPYRISYFNRPIYTVITRPRPSRPVFQGSYNRWRPGDVRRPSFNGNNPRYTGNDRRPTFNREERREYINRNDNNTYRSGGGTYRFTGNPGADFSDPRRVPNVNLQDQQRRYLAPNLNNVGRPAQGSSNSYRTPSVGSTFQQRPGVQSTIPGMNIYNNPGYNPSHSSQNRPSYSSPSFGSGSQNNRPGGGNNNNNNRPSMSSGSQNRTAPAPIMRPSAGRNMGAPSVGRRNR